jgi:hypothetical protein
MSLYTQLENVKAAAKAKPDRSAAQDILALVKQGPPFDDLFFTQISDPTWLPLLSSGGFFENWPEPESAGDGRIIYKHHVPLMGLARLAKLAPVEVTNLLVKLSVPNNPTIGDQILRCVIPINDRKCIELLSPLVVRLMSESPWRSTGIWLNELLKVWIEAGALLDSLTVVRSYLFASIKSSSEVSPGSDTWLLRETNRDAFRKLTAEYPQEVAEIFFTALQLWADKERNRQADRIESLAAELDYDLDDERELSTYWLEDFRNATESHREFEGTLAFCLFSAAQKIYEHGDAGRIAALDQILRSNSWSLYARLRWQLYADFPAQTLELARPDVIARMPKLNRADCTHGYEFAQMLQTHSKLHKSAFLSIADVKTFFETVFSGPLDVNGELMRDYAVYFRIKQLWPIATLLQGKELEAYQELPLGSDEIDFDSYKPIRYSGSDHEIEHVPPKEAENFASMPSNVLWNFLNTWQPKGKNLSESWVQEDFDALATKFAEFIESQPARFKPEDKWWENLKRPALLYKFLDRGSKRIEKKPESGSQSVPQPSEVDWANWFGVAKWTASRRPIVGKKGNNESDWTWARIVVATFLQVVLRSKNQPPEVYIPDVETLLKDLIYEEDSRLDQRDSAGMGEWLTAAINSVRGDALEALLQLALNQKNGGKDIAPWIFATIRARLELPTESPAIFALLGSKLRLFIHLFEDTLIKMPTLLFPDDRPLHQQAAIVAHFGYDHPWNKVLKSFPELINTALKIYARTRATAKDNEAKETRREFGSQLGTHIACYYWNGSFPSNVEGEKALDYFFAIASRSTRAMVISQIATIWEKPSQEKPNQNDIARVMRIWERRHTEIVKKLNEQGASLSDHEKELAAFTRWLSCECFPFEWRVSQVNRVIAQLEKSPESFHLLEAITKYAVQPERQEASLQLLQALLSRPSDQLRWAIQYKELSPAIFLGLTSQNANIKVLAESCRDLLLKMGFFEFLELGQETK